MLSTFYLRLPTGPKRTRFRSEQKETCRLLFGHLTAFLLKNEGSILSTGKQVQVVEYYPKLFVNLN